MRVKKALKQLGKAESLVDTVATRFTGIDVHLKELLDAATKAIGQAKSGLKGSPQKSPSPSEPPSVAERSHGQAANVGTLSEFNGNKRDFVRAIVRARGSSGVIPREVNEAFAVRGISKSKNFVYNSLNALTKQGDLKKKGNRYMSASVDSGQKRGLAKNRLSPQGIKRIREANKKRWAKRKAA